MSQIQFFLLTHPNELAKATNTGRLIKTLLPETEIIEWSRVASSEWLLETINDKQQSCFLVMPQQYAIYQQDAKVMTQTVKKKCYILLDGTWQQARKIYRQSPYLHTLPLCFFDQAQASIYTLRRNQLEQGLCTAEVAAEILKQSGEAGRAGLLMNHLSAFCEEFR